MEEIYIDEEEMMEKNSPAGILFFHSLNAIKTLSEKGNQLYSREQHF